MVTFLTPAVTALVLLYYIAFWAIGIGVLQIVAAIRLRKEIEGELWLILSGIVSVAFGVLLVARPGVGVLSVLWLIAFYAIVFGVTLIFLSFRVRGFVNRVASRARA